MEEKLGIEGCKAVVKALGQCGTVVAKFFNKEGLFVLIGLQGPVQVLVATKWDQVLAEVKDLGPEERLVLEKELSDSFQPPQQGLDLGLDKFLALGEKSGALVEKVIADGKSLVDSVKLLVGEWKAFLGVV